MIRKGYYCKYKNKVFMCDLDYSTVLLRSHDIEDLEKNGFEKNPYFGQNKFYDVGKYIKVVPNEEIEWLNNYHQIVYEKLSPNLNEEEKVWLQEATASI